MTTAMAGAGEKLTDAELLGCPLRITVGPRGLAEGEVEARSARQAAKTSASPSPKRAARRAAALEGLTLSMAESAH